MNFYASLKPSFDELDQLQSNPRELKQEFFDKGFLFKLNERTFDIF